jgi:hypothetical protein
MTRVKMRALVPRRSGPDWPVRRVHRRIHEHNPRLVRMFHAPGLTLFLVNSSQDSDSVSNSKSQAMQTQCR